MNPLSDPMKPDQLTASTAVSGLGALFLWANQRMNPMYFALVMATGIISIALGFLQLPLWSQVFFWVNVVAYPLLVILTFVRIVLFPKDIWNDLTNPATMFAFFTFVAGSNVFGTQLYQHGRHTLALVLWIIASVVWLALIYFTFAWLTFTNKHPPREIVNGGWLVSVVSTQSIVVLGCLLASQFGPNYSLVVFSMYCLWAFGVILYLLLITFIMHRLVFDGLEPADLLPPYWINMGATAISTLAGANLYKAALQVSFLTSLRPSMAAISVGLWAWCTWWIPLLILFMIWRHKVQKVPFTYHPAYWSMVFPLGMFTAATFQLHAVLDLDPLQAIPSVMIVVALVAWTFTAGGLLSSLYSAIKQSIMGSN